MKTNPGLFVVSLAMAVSGELAPRDDSGQGYNLGNSGKGYNPGKSLVAFSANRGVEGSRGKLGFGKTLTSLGGGWNGRTGEFRAPARGTYVFSWSAVSGLQPPAVNNLLLALMLNELEQASSWADRHQTASGTAILTLRRGDVVYLRILEGHVYEPRSNSDRGYTAFSGHRIG